MTQYTFTFKPEYERKFKSILERLDPDEYTIIEDIKLLDEEHPRYSERQTIMDMDAESALTFRLGMKELVIRRERTEEELAEEKEIEDRTTIKVTIKVNGPIEDETKGHA